MLPSPANAQQDLEQKATRTWHRTKVDFTHTTALHTGCVLACACWAWRTAETLQALLLLGWNNSTKQTGRGLNNTHGKVDQIVVQVKVLLLGDVDCA